MFLKNRQLAVGSWQLAVTWRLLVVVLMFAFLLAGNTTQQAQEARRNAEAQKLKNPEPNNPEAVEAGKKLYQRYCASCHGPQAKGDGGMSLAGGTPSDLTDETWDYGSTDGEIFVAIREGVSSDMLAYQEKLNEKQTWQVVHYLRSLGPKPKEDK